MKIKAVYDTTQLWPVGPSIGRNHPIRLVTNVFYRLYALLQPVITHSLCQKMFNFFRIKLNALKVNCDWRTCLSFFWPLSFFMIFSQSSDLGRYLKMIIKAELLMYGGLYTMAVYWPYYLIYWNNIKSGKTVARVFLPLPKWKTIHFKWNKVYFVYLIFKLLEFNDKVISYARGKKLIYKL